MSTNEDIIRKLAQDIWEAEGRPEGRASEHWERAAKQAAAANRGDDEHAKRSVDPSEAKGPAEPAQPDQT
jgi:hypothetical protein